MPTEPMPSFTLSSINADQIYTIVKLQGHNTEGPAFELRRKAIA
jgi:hypothetical protein